MKRLFAAIVVTTCAVGLMPLSASADDDWEDRFEDYEDYLEDLREEEEERREDYEDWLEDQRERQQKYWRKYRRYVPVQPAYPPAYGQYYYAPPAGVKHEGAIVYPQPYPNRGYVVPQPVQPTPHVVPVPEALPIPGGPTTPRLAPPSNGRTYRVF
jgi:hypothetical protein